MIEPTSNLRGTALLSGWPLVVAICAVCICDTAGVRVSALLYCDYALVAKGQCWRLLSSWMAHDGALHAILDTVYLLGLILVWRHLVPQSPFALVFLACDWIGTIGSFYLDSYYSSTTGSSAGSHGCLATLAIILIAPRSRVHRACGLLILSYLIYMSLWGIMTGRMPWPLQSFENCGWDHGLAVIVGVVAGMSALRLSGGEQ